MKEDRFYNTFSDPSCHRRQRNYSEYKAMTSFSTISTTVSSVSEQDPSSSSSLPNHLDIDHARITDNASVSSHDLESRTTSWQSFLHLVKGYIGPGCLSLPWAVSQLGIAGGCLACCIMAYWSSYNCWTVLRLKRIMMIQEQEEANGDISRGRADSENNHGGCANDETDSISSQSDIRCASKLTYPEVAGWLFGKKFERFTSACICVQQLAICTVFLSFVGANLKAVLEATMDIEISHAGVISLALPAALGLSLLPDLKTLAPVMAWATALLMIALGLVLVVIMMEWEHRPQHAPVEDWSKAPLALCAILYSYEGICLILPVESAMAKPRKFKFVFVSAMVVAAFVFCVTSVLSVAAFGRVTNGSITAFLMETQASDSRVKALLLAANGVVSLSVLLTYPLQLFPCLEIIGLPISCRFFRRHCPPCVESIQNDFVAVDEIMTDREQGTSPTDNNNCALHRGEPLQQEAYREGDGLVNVSAATYAEVREAKASSIASYPTRILLVLLTYIIAIAIPNVEALISLAGALAGSSTALLIPPALQLAWYRRHGNENDGNSSLQNRRCNIFVCYALFFGGLFFMVVGTIASITDIVRSGSG